MARRRARAALLLAVAAGASGVAGAAQLASTGKVSKPSALHVHLGAAAGGPAVHPSVIPCQWTVRRCGAARKAPRSVPCTSRALQLTLARCLS
jgi:hypothetical protein